MIRRPPRSTRTDNTLSLHDALPILRVLDVRKRPLDAGLSTELLDAAGNALDTDGQVLVFKNRRGYAPVLLCHDCGRSEEHTSELQSLMRSSYAVFCLKKKKQEKHKTNKEQTKRQS